MSTSGRAKALIYSLIGVSVLAGVTVALLGIFGNDIFPNKSAGGSWEDPNLSYVKTPSLDQLRAGFAPDTCFDTYDLAWTSGKDGQIYANTAPFFVKGKSLRVHEVCVCVCGWGVGCVRACVRGSLIALLVPRQNLSPSLPP